MALSFLNSDVEREEMCAASFMNKKTGMCYIQAGTRSLTLTRDT